ncbi:restriction endonuclease subunit S [Thalassococcus sp. CAU 1522]|uniref:Restriction endonuclease subunit S n=1 Tax=Thalassococcus arenae TaxID=2851652 RepID=A0ABS6NBN1_9RHOB|nr:restriction endonuclease subunit S [Thalassococcus arenae]MBV2361431.1 restriction endonuclease subunit S [Thalassococcus arenae]
MSRLGDVCEFVYGKSLPASKRKEGSIAVYGSNGAVGFHCDAVTKSPAIIVGRKGSIGKLIYSEKPCWPIDTTYYVEKDSTDVDLRWLFHAMQSLRLDELNKATGVPGLNRNDAYERKLFVPSTIDEQRRIASILDKADAIRRKRQQALALADDFLKSVFVEMFGDPETNPKQLPQEELGKLLERIDSGHSPKCEARPAAEDEIGILKVSSISSTHFRPEENKAVFEGYPIDERNLVHKGDLLFSRKNTYQLVGASAIVENAHGKLALPDLIFRLVPRSDRKIELPYLWMLLTQDSIRERLRKVAGGSAASMPNIGKERLRSVLLPIAKPEDQVQFTKYYSKRISLKKKLQDNLILSEDLFASLSQRAFRGEL